MPSLVRLYSHTKLMLASKNYIDFEVLDPVTNQILSSWSGAEKVNRALPEDIVHLGGDGTVEFIERAAKKPLVGVLQLTSKYMYGMTGHGVPLYLCSPLNKGYPSFRIACKERDRSRNLLISFQFESWEPGCELPRGALLRILGPVEDFAAESEALAILSSPWSAPRPASAPLFQASDRRILSDGTFNIDPVGCQDIDDVLTIVNLGNGTVRLWITIADVSELVSRGTPVWEAAQKNGATTYQDGRAVRPMFHRDLSEKACSLLPLERRYGLALRIDWMPGKGFVSKPEFEKVMVINQQSFTYESIYEAETSLLETIACMASDLAGRKITDSHEWIEQFMLFYNRCAARVLKKANSGLLRAHDAPFFEKLATLDGISPSLRFLAYQSAKYVAVGQKGEAGHWGLQEDLYCHATSPLRRFADLINQQIIKKILDGALITEDLAADQRLAHHLNRRQKQIHEAERNWELLKAITQAEKAEVGGIYLWQKGEKAEFYVEAWKCTIRFLVTVELEVGKKYKIQYYCDRRKASWKERMIYRLFDDSVEQ